MLVEQERIAADSPCVAAHCVALAKYGTPAVLGMGTNSADSSGLTNRPDPCPSWYYWVESKSVHMSQGLISKAPSHKGQREYVETRLKNKRLQGLNRKHHRQQGRIFPCLPNLGSGHRTQEPIKIAFYSNVWFKGDDILLVELT